MEVQQAEEAEAAELARVDKLEAELAQAERELSQLGASSSELDGLEERYWHDFNDFQLQLRAHIDERDVLVNRVCAFKCPAMAGIICSAHMQSGITCLFSTLTFTSVSLVPLIYFCIASTPCVSHGCLCPQKAMANWPLAQGRSYCRSWHTQGKLKHCFGQTPEHAVLFLLSCYKQADGADGVWLQMEHSAAHLKRLQQTNVYHDVFRIWHDGAFGTIGGFRLGRTADTPVEWDEINAAWGQTVLLLKTMAQVHAPQGLLLTLCVCLAIRDNCLPDIVLNAQMLFAC